MPKPEIAVEVETWNTYNDSTGQVRWFAYLSRYDNGTVVRSSPAFETQAEALLWAERYLCDSANGEHLTEYCEDPFE